MREKMYSPDIAVLATSDDNVVGNRHETVHCVRVTRELVTVQPILTPVQNMIRKYLVCTLEITCHQRLKED